MWVVASPDRVRNACAPGPGLGLRYGLGLVEATESWTCKLNANESFASFSVTHVHDAALGGEVYFFFFAASSEMGLRDADFEVRADRYVETGDECGAAAAEIFAGGFFFEMGAAGIAASDLERKADGNPTLRARFRGGRAAADFLKHALGPRFHF